MEIIRKESNNFRNYGDILVGTVFELDRDIYIKTNIPEDYADISDLQAVSLSSGCSLPIGYLVKVKVLDAKLTVEDA